MPARAVNWLAPSGETGEAIAGALKECSRELLLLGSDIYPSMDMKKDIDTQLLEARAPILEKLLALDTRGGYFGQGDVLDGVRLAIKAAGLDGSWQTKGNDYEVTAYKLRVMLAHVRMKVGDACSPPLKALIDHIDQKKSKNVERSARDHPFPAFRDTASDEQDAEVCHHHGEDAEP